MVSTNVICDVDGPANRRRSVHTFGGVLSESRGRTAGILAPPEYDARSGEFVPIAFAPCAVGMALPALLRDTRQLSLPKTR